MKYFIATRWANMKHVQTLTENLDALGHQVFSFVQDKRNFVSAQELKKPKLMADASGNWRDNKNLKEMYERNLEALRDSDVVIMLLPAGATSHINAGIAFGLGKRMILIGEPEKPEAQYHIFDEFYPTIEAYLATLKK